MVVNGLQVVRSVRATDVHLESGERDPGIVVGEEESQDIEDGELGINNLLDDVEIGFSVLETSLAISRLHN